MPPKIRCDTMLAFTSCSECRRSGYEVWIWNGMGTKCKCFCCNCEHERYFLYMKDTGFPGSKKGWEQVGGPFVLIEPASILPKLMLEPYREESS